MPLPFSFPPAAPAYAQLDELAITLPPKQEYADDPAPTREDSVAYLKSTELAGEIEDWKIDRRHRDAIAKWNAAPPRIGYALAGLDETPEDLAKAGMFPPGQLEADDQRVWLGCIAQARGITIEEAAIRFAVADAEMDPVAKRAKFVALQAGAEWPKRALRSNERNSRCPCCGQAGELIYATDRIAAKCLRGCAPDKLAEAIQRFVIWDEARRVQEETERQRNRLRATVSLRQAIATVPAAPPQLIDGVLPAESFVMLHAPSGGRKTMTSISWLVAVAAGKPWLGRATRQVNVLAILLEGARREHLRWIQQLAAGLGASADDLEGKLDLYPDALKADDPASLASVATRVQALEHKLVVIDNLSQIHSGGHGAENDARAMHAVLRPLEQLVRFVPGLTVVVLHHANAAGDPRGRDGIKQHFDRSLSLEASSDHNDAIITLASDGKHRDGFELDEDLRWRFVGGPTDPALQMTLVGARKVASAEIAEDPARVKMLGLLPATSSAIYTGMGGNRNAVKRLRDALEAEGLIVERDGVWIRIVE